jgi:type VI secretion system protein ImpJ
MDALRPVFWGQGMFLQPQHFQQQDHYHDSRLRRYLQLVSPFCWGVASMTVNEAALRNFRFEVEQCEAVTWEGTILHFQGESFSGNARLAPRPFEDALDPGGKPLGVYLGVKRLRREEANVDLRGAPSSNGAATDHTRRFSIRESSTPDLFAPDGRGCPVQYLCYDVRILFEDEVANDQDYELVKVAEVLRSAEGHGAFLSKQYIPPCLTVRSSPVLEGMLKEFRELLTAKGRELSEYKRQHTIHTIDMGSRDTVFLLMMQTVNRYIPLFHHHLEVEETHPGTLYALLRQVVGELSTFSETVSALGDPRRLPAYRHDRLWECFDPALRLAKELLNELTKGPDYVVPLAFDGQYFAADLEKRFFEGNNRYYLAIKVDIPPRELLRLLTETGKVCSREEMEALRRQALPGVRIDHLEVPPEELPRRAHCSYFLVDHHSPLWRRIEQRQNLAVYCELPPQKTDMQLLVIFET